MQKTRSSFKCRLFSDNKRSADDVTNFCPFMLGSALDKV